MQRLVPTRIIARRRARTLAVALSAVLAGAALYAGNVRAQTSTLPSTGTIAIPTYEAVGLYWQSPGGSAGCEVKYRKWGTTAWAQGLAMWYDSRDAQCRGSLIGLTPGTDYQVEFNLPGQAATRGLVFKTWANQVPVAKTITVSAASGTTFNVAEGGTASGYVVYDGKGAVLDGANSAQYNVTINASHVIVRGLTLRGAKQDAIRVSPTVHDVIIEDNDISGWGRTRDGTWGTDMDSGIRAVCSTPTMERVTIQRNKIHDPRYSANSWSDGHPAGPQAVSFSYCGGNHVIRHNEMYSTTGKYFNDVIGGEDNFTKTGFPNADTDIYGNRISHGWDDGIEAEGANENVRIWGNYIDSTAIGVATTVTSVGPVYIFRNVWNRSKFYQKASPDQDERQPFFKSGSDASLGNGRRYLLHNTMLQATQSGASYGLGGGAGVGGTGSTQPINNTVSMNNIYHLWKPNSAMYQVGSGNQFANDLYNGSPGEAVYTNGMQGTPQYASGNGWQSEAGGMYQLASSSPGFGRGAKIANFNDGVSAPDVGAHQSGTSAMKFGVAGSTGSAVGGSGTVTPPPPPPPPAGSYALTVGKAGTGTGTVTSAPAGISCGSACSASLASGTAVTLTASPAAGSTFGGWSGGCTGTGACTVSMTAARSVTATFTAQATGMVLSKTALKFGTASVTQYVTLTNKTTTTQTVKSVVSGSTKYTIRSMCTTLAPGRACSVGVTYIPTRAGSKAATVTITTTAPNSPQALNVSAT
jgi:hypothetical protein